MSQLTGNILVVEDEHGIRLFLEHLLQRDGHRVVLAANGEEALPLINVDLDLAILDLNLGKGLSGLDVLEEIRRRAPATEVILLTGNGTLETAVAALREGAHDYLFKPCQAKQLRESVSSGLHKRLRRRQQASLFEQLEQNLSLLAAFKNDALETQEPTTAVPSPTQPPAKATNSTEPETTPQTLRHGRVLIDKVRHTVSISNDPLELSPLEFDILTYLVEQAPRVVSPQDIMQTIHGYDISASEASDVVRTNIYRIRQKIKQLGDNYHIIRTVRGVGYTLEG
jgi:DNA-binding response OmpR family regulator